MTLASASMTFPAFSKAGASGFAEPQHHQSDYRVSFKATLHEQHHGGQTDMRSLGKVTRTFHGDPRPNISHPKGENTDWLKDQARKESAKEGAAKAAMSPKAFENLQQGRNKISFDSLVEWCRNDPEFAAAFAEHIGLILPGGVGYLDALVQFAGEVIRLNAMLDQIEVERLEENRERCGAA